MILDVMIAAIVVQILEEVAILVGVMIEMIVAHQTVVQRVAVQRVVAQQAIDLQVVGLLHVAMILDVMIVAIVVQILAEAAILVGVMTETIVARLTIAHRVVVQVLALIHVVQILVVMIHAATATVHALILRALHVYHQAKQDLITILVVEQALERRLVCQKNAVEFATVMQSKTPSLKFRMTLTQNFYRNRFWPNFETFHLKLLTM
jgi:hypothetical protein